MLSGDFYMHLLFLLGNKHISDQESLTLSEMYESEDVENKKLAEEIIIQKLKNRKRKDEQSRKRSRDA